MNSFHIRRLEKENMDESLELSSFAFQYELTPEEREKRKQIQRPDITWGCFEGERLCAKATVHPFRIWLSGRSVRMGGVASVATWPEYRRQGMVNALMLHALRTMKDEGVTVSMLHPFSVPFYRKYGWEMVVDYKQYEIETTKLRHGIATTGTMEYVADPSAHLERFHEIYTAYARKYNGMLDREEKWWKLRVFKGGRSYIYTDEQGAEQGYVLYELKEGKLTVQECIWLTPDARAGVLAFLANHDSMADKVVMRAPADDRLPFMAADPRFKQETVPYFMGRIVDVQAFVSAYAFQCAGEAVSLKLRVLDEAAVWNHGDFELDVDGSGLGRFEPTAREPDVVCGIQALSAMLLGYMRPMTLSEMGRLQGDAAAIEKLERIIPHQVPYLMDYF